MTLRDGPAKGTYAVTRAPLYLRATTKPRARGMAPEADVLDQLEDSPADDELVYVYRRDEQGIVGWVHAKRRRYVVAEYYWMSGVDGSRLRDNAAWQEWAQAQVGDAS